MIFGKWGNICATAALVIYLVGVMISKTIATGSVLANTFSEVRILNESKFWIILFFSISIIFSFSNVAKTKIL